MVTTINDKKTQSLMTYVTWQYKIGSKCKQSAKAVKATREKAKCIQSKLNCNLAATFSILFMEFPTFFHYSNPNIEIRFFVPNSQIIYLFFSYYSNSILNSNIINSIYKKFYTLFICDLPNPTKYNINNHITITKWLDFA